MAPYDADPPEWDLPDDPFDVLLTEWQAANHAYLMALTCTGTPF